MKRSRSGSRSVTDAVKPFHDAFIIFIDERCPQRGAHRLKRSITADPIQKALLSKGNAMISDVEQTHRSRRPEKNGGLAGKAPTYNSDKTSEGHQESEVEANCHEHGPPTEALKRLPVAHRRT